MAVGDLDTVRLRDFLARRRPELAGGPLTAELIPGGRSNLTYTVTDGTSSWILRRPPPGQLLATAHDMGREYRVMAALADTAVPVPQVLLLHEDPELLGAPFYLMEEIAGTVYRRLDQTSRLGGERARALSYRLIDVLAELHAVDPVAVGLADFGRPDGYLERQVRRWRTQLDASRSRELPELDELQRLLSADVPVSRRHGIVHGDFRLDNTIVAADDRVAAVVDWELATLGDPLADLGLFAVYWDGVVDLPGQPLGDGISPAVGFPRAAELADHYAARTGADLTNLPWYEAFGHFKLAVVAEGVHYRSVHGQTAGPGFEGFGDAVVPLARRGLAVLTAR